MCRSAGDTFARRPTTPDICHYTSEFRGKCDVGIHFSDSAGFCVYNSHDHGPTDTAARRTAVPVVKYSCGAGPADPGECRQSEDNHGAVRSWVVSAAVAADVARSVDDDKNAVRPARDAAPFTARCSSDNPAIFCRLFSQSSARSVLCYREKSTFDSIRCYTRSCPAR